MSYDKVLIDESGEEYPYSEDIGDDGYHYKISIVFEEKDGELSIINEGMDILFDDGSMLDFNISPEQILPNKKQLEKDDLLNLMNFMCYEKIRHNRRYYSPEEVVEIYAKFEEYMDSKKINSNQSLELTRKGAQSVAAESISQAGQD